MIEEWFSNVRWKEEVFLDQSGRSCSAVKRRETIESGNDEKPFEPILCSIILQRSGCFVKQSQAYIQLKSTHSC